MRYSLSFYVSSCFAPGRPPSLEYLGSIHAGLPGASLTQRLSARCLRSQSVVAHLAFSTLRISLPSPLLHLLPLPGLPFRRACAGLGRCSERGASEASEPPSRCLSPTRIGRSLFRLSTAGPPVSSFSLSPARFPLKKASEKGQAPYRGRSLPALSSVGSTMPPLALLFFFFFFFLFALLCGWPIFVPVSKYWPSPSCPRPARQPVLVVWAGSVISPSCPLAPWF